MRMTEKNLKDAMACLLWYRTKFNHIYSHYCEKDLFNHFREEVTELEEACDKFGPDDERTLAELADCYQMILAIMDFYDIPPSRLVIALEENVKKLIKRANHLTD